MTQWRRRLATSDPGHVRATNTLAVTVAVLLSSGASWLIVDHDIADRGFFASAILLTVQMCMSINDATPRARLVTSAAAMIPMLVAPAVAIGLDRWRDVEIAVFIVLAGVAVWLRRYGPRSSQLGMIGFFAYFYALVLQPPLAQLPGYLLLMASVTASVVVVRAALLTERPAHQLAVLLAELRTASAAALTAATRTVPGTDRFRLLKGPLHAIDTVSRAVNGWQLRFTTADVVDCTDHTLANRTLDARIDVEHTVLEIAGLVHTGGTGSLPAPLNDALADLMLMLDDDASATAHRAAADRARGQRTAAAEELPAALTTYVTARSTLAHWALRRIDLTAPYSGDSPAAAAAAVAKPAAAKPAADKPAPDPPPAARRGEFWRTWTPSTRMAVQAMVAAALATVIGEVIDASKWYWAVMASFTIFVGTTRGSVLTRASRRVLGTVVAIAFGVVVAITLDGPSYWHLVIGIVGVIGVFYLGPVSQIYAAFFLTLLLVSQYGLLGVLNRHVMALRLEETIAGILVGVTCAYLVFSTDSKQTLNAGIAAYLDALVALLDRIRSAMSRPGQTPDLIDAVGTLDSAQEKLDAATSSMSASFLNGRTSRVTSLRHLMRVASRSAEHAAQSAIHVTDRTPGLQLTPPEAIVFDDAVAEVIADANRARGALLHGSSPIAPREESGVAVAADELRAAGEAAPAHALLMLSRVDWALGSASRIRSEDA